MHLAFFVACLNVICVVFSHHTIKRFISGNVLLLPSVKTLPDINLFTVQAPIVNKSTFWTYLLQVCMFIVLCSRYVNMYKYSVINLSDYGRFN